MQDQPCTGRNCAGPCPKDDCFVWAVINDRPPVDKSQRKLSPHVRAMLESDERPVVAENIKTHQDSGPLLDLAISTLESVVESFQDSVENLRAMLDKSEQQYQNILGMFAEHVEQQRLIYGKVLNAKDPELLRELLPIVERLGLELLHMRKGDQ